MQSYCFILCPTKIGLLNCSEKSKKSASALFKGTKQTIVHIHTCIVSVVNAGVVWIFQETFPPMLLVSSKKFRH